MNRVDVFLISQTCTLHKYLFINYIETQTFLNFTQKSSTVSYTGRHYTISCKCIITLIRIKLTYINRTNNDITKKKLRRTLAYWKRNYNTIKSDLLIQNHHYQKIFRDQLSSNHLILQYNNNLFYRRDEIF